MSYDLTLEVSPERLTDSLVSDVRAAVARAEALAGVETIWPRHDGPPTGNLKSLEGAFRDREATREDFLAFCARRGLDAKVDLAAGHFLAHIRGIVIAQFVMPAGEDDVRAAFAALRAIAEVLQLSLHDPQYGAAIPVSFTGSLPPQY